MQFQQKLKKKYTFEGKGLHTGQVAVMTLGPAPVDTGIVFRRVDLGEAAIVEALAENVSNTARSTTISRGEVSVSTIEHVMSALTGLGIDNAYIDIDNVEVPILDGSAKPYIDAMWKDGGLVQDAPRRYNGGLQLKSARCAEGALGFVCRVCGAGGSLQDIRILP